MKNYMSHVKKLTLGVIKQKLSREFVSFQRSNLPKERGIYLIYCKEIPRTLLYVGCAHRDGRTIKTRCGQNLAPKNTGGTFRKRVEVKENLTAEEAVAFIMENCVLKFLIVDSKTESRDILLLERACISCLTPQYNDLLPREISIRGL